jgi:hypothetical protein
VTSLRAGIRICLPLIALLACQPGSPSLKLPVTPSTHTSFPITTGPHAVDCGVCHGAYSSFTQFSCLNCHGHEQPLTDLLHVSLTPPAGTSLPDGGVGYSYDSASCLSCHPSGGKVAFDHAGIAGGCLSCHATGGPFDSFPVGVGLDGGAFTHPPIGSADCGACHSTTTWLGAGKPPTDLVGDPAQDLVVPALVPSYVGTSVSALTPETESLSMPMNHQTTELPAAVLANCSTCHDTSTGTYFPGVLHSSLANNVPVLPQPTACMDCHASSMPVGFVGPSNASRNPASGAMKHDAVVWNSAGPTTTTAVPYDCGVCHEPPSGSLAATWATNTAGTTPALFHASLTAASQPQPASCVDCHANSRPNAVLTAANSGIAAGLTFDHASGAAMGDCGSCHVNASAAATQWTSWSKGKFHLPNSASPATCLPCHGSERPTSNTGWVSTTYQSSPFDYGTNSSGVTHGDGLDCATCHRGPGTGTWGSTQNWVGGNFTHGPATVSGTTCIACHVSQRPTAVVNGFDHSANGTGDCLGCHQATVSRGRYVSYLVPGGDWQGGVGYPGSTLVGSPNQFITVTETNLNRTGSLVTGSSSISATLYNMMLHVSAALPPELNAGPTATPDYTKCWHCHTSTNGTVTSYADGKYHSSLSNYSATPGGTITPLPQPTTLCTDCHVQMRPAGIVMKNGSDLQPMDHNAMFTAPVTIGGVSVTGVAGIECAVCHHNPGVSWADGQPAQTPLFHANIGAAVPQDCTVCHYPLMADAPKADLTNGTRYSMRHLSGQITSQSCQACHTTALSKAANTPIAATLWQTGAYHASLATQPKACVDCHTPTRPAANASTQSSWSYTLALGATSTNQGQWMNHGSSWVAGKDCVLCHAADAKTSGSAWSKADKFHGPVASPTTCKECHGLTNGGGSVAGTKNNLPTGLTNSTMLTTASADATTGVPAGTYDQITHTDVNISSRDCNFCHAQAGISTLTGVQGKEWAQASFHVKFTSASPLIMNGTTGRCSNCHMNVKPGPTFTTFDHSTFTATSGTPDCSSCHSWPGTGTAQSPNWLGAAAMPAYISVGGFTVSQPPASSALLQTGIGNLPHPAVAVGVACTTCHATSTGGKGARGYDHLSTLINSNCNSCHEAGTNLIGTLWNGATAQSAGAGDSRPYTLASVLALQRRTITTPNHFYPVDCKECHNIPAGNGYVTTGTAYATAWKFPHTTSKMSNPTTCKFCHP